MEVTFAITTRSLGIHALQNFETSAKYKKKQIPKNDNILQFKSFKICELLALY